MPLLLHMGLKPGSDKVNTVTSGSQAQAKPFVTPLIGLNNIFYW